MKNIRIIGPKELKHIQNESGVINTTTSSKESWSRQLSPMLLSAQPLAKNMENLWQFSKVYTDHVDQNNNPTPDFFTWQRTGFGDSWAHRYPKGKGAVPLYSLWDGEKLSYIEARKKIYIPEYIRCVQDTPGYKQLEDLHKKQDIILFDYDGYDHDKLGLTIQEVIDSEARKMGHAFALKILLTGGVY